MKTYTSKYGLVLNQSEDMSDIHFQIVCDIADKDPVENLKAGRYMPRVNGQRICYRGKDTWLGIKSEIPLFLFFVLILIAIIVISG